MNLSGNPLDYLIVFFGGVLVSFSPCVFPLIPITLSVIGVESELAPLKSLRLSLIYVLGIAITYSLLGLIAALGGRLFGEIALHQISLLFIGAACIITGLSFCGALRINFYGPNLNHRLRKGKGILPVFFMGLVSGLAVGPCTAPILGTILLYVAGKKDTLYGISLLFTFAYGVGFILILAGVFSTIILKKFNFLHWFGRLRKISGIVLIIIGIYFIIKSGGLI